jgi:hypothetical protein
MIASVLMSRLDPFATVVVTKDFLIRVDSYCSLVAYRHPGDIPRDVIEQLKRLSGEARQLYERLDTPDNQPYQDEAAVTDSGV